jgi:hypothetical protein
MKARAIHGLILLLLAPPLDATEVDLYATEVRANGGWQHPERAQGEPEAQPCPCNNLWYALNLQGNDILEAVRFPRFALTAGERIAEVRINVILRYDDDTRGRARLWLSGPTPRPIAIDSESFLSSGGMCRWVMGDRRDVTGLLEWDEEAVNSIRLGVQRIGDNTTTLRVRAFKIYVRTEPCAYSVAPTTVTVPGEGGEVLVDVATQVGCSWEAGVPIAVTWIERLAPQEVVQGSGSAAFLVDPNPGCEAREAAVCVAGTWIHVLQSGLTCSYGVEPTLITAPPGGGDFAIDVRAPSCCPCSAVSETPWIRIVPGSEGCAGGKAVIHVDESPTTQERPGTLKVAGTTITVRQMGWNCSYDIRPAGVGILAEGEKFCLDVTAPAACPWPTVQHSEWISISQPGPGSGSGRICFAVEPNPAYEPREGFVAMGDRRVEVRQEAETCRPEDNKVQPGSLQFGPDGGDLPVTVTAPDGCPWTAVADEDWIAIEPGGTREGDGTVTVRAAPNRSLEPRFYTLTIAGRPIEVAQEARAPVLRVSVKVVLGDGGARPGIHYNTHDQVTRAIDEANGILGQSDIPWRLFLWEIVDLEGCGRYFALEGYDRIEELEREARADPVRFAWRDDGINIYVVHRIFNAQAVASFPPGELIAINSYSGVRNGGGGWLHEIGHYLSLLHTFDCRFGDCVEAKTECRGEGASHLSPRGHVRCPDVCGRHEGNPMSYFTYPLREAAFTHCQKREMEYELLDPAGSRSRVLIWNPTRDSITLPDGLPIFVRGDSNGDGRVDIADAVKALEHLFLGTAEIRCLAAADADGSDVLDLTDPIGVLGHLFLGGPGAIAEPGPHACSPDRDSLLGCAEYDPEACPPPLGEGDIEIEG